MGIRKSSFEKNILSRWRFGIYLLRHLPLGWVAGLRVEQYDALGATVSVPYCFITKNPFRSIYFAPLSMAAELASGLPALGAVKKAGQPISMLVVGMQAEYLKKARSRTHFRCNDRAAFETAVTEALKNPDGTRFTSLSEGTDSKGEMVARFHIIWTFKQKKHSNHFKNTLLWKF